MKLEIIREKTAPEQPIKYVYYGISERENETGEITSKGEIIIIPEDSDSVILSQLLLFSSEKPIWS